MPGESFPKRRQSAADKAKAWARKKHCKRPRFPRSEPKGKVIYRNENAVAVNPKIGRRGKRAPFILENVEWIGIREEIGHGDHGFVTWGKIKFKGLPSPKRVVIKRYGSSRKFVSPEILQRLEKSGVAFPKMAFLTGTVNAIVMEPFIRNKEGKIVSKFLPNQDILSNLDLNTLGGQKLFRQSLDYAAKLARVGLGIEYPSLDGDPRADIFNVITLGNGERKLFVQDLDTFVMDENVEHAWRTSTNTIAMAAGTNAENSRLARKMVTEFTKKLGFL